MNNSYVISFSAQDEPGIVERLSSIISDCEGNWLESAMSHLAGRFVGIVVVEIGGTQALVLTKSLQALHTQGWDLTIEPIDSAKEDQEERQYIEISLTGHDRQGIVSEISGVLAKHGANVEDLTSELVSGSMSAELLFKADIHASVNKSSDLDDLQEAIEAIANDLMVDIVIL